MHILFSPYNPFIEFSAETPEDFVFKKVYPNNEIHKSTDNSNTAKLIFEYLSSLELIPLKETMNDFQYHESNIFFLDRLRFGAPSYNTIYINDIYVDDLTILYINANRPGFKDGYYKIMDDKFDYEYINNLLIKDD